MLGVSQASMQWSIILWRDWCCTVPCQTLHGHLVCTGGLVLEFACARLRNKHSFPHHM